ncbi:MAG: MFS transporter [Firmicutes bacterium]|nr:MFS transporter [Bacillota bacterium]
MRRLQLPSLSRDVWRVIAVNAAMTSLFTFVSIFVNLYWWNQGAPIFQVSLFNLASTLALFLAYWAGTYVLSQRDIRLVMVFSTIGAGLTFGTLAASGTGRHLGYTVAVGVLFGLTQGFFWAGNNASMYTVLPAEQYGDYFSALTVIGQAGSVVVPLVTGAAVAAWGFHASFLAMLLVVAAAFGVAVQLPHRGFDDEVFRDLHIRHVVNRPGTAWVLLVVFFAGLINQFVTLFSLVYLFTISTQVGVVTALNLASALILLAALAAYRRLRLTQDAWIVIGSASLALAFGLALALRQGPWAIVVVFLLRVGGLWISGASGRQRYRIVMQGDVVWRTRFGLWMEVPFVVSRTVVLTGSLWVHRLGDPVFLGLMGLTVVALGGLPWATRKAIRAYDEAVQWPAQATS